MAKAHWGIKRVCNSGSCGAKFYDFNEKAIACPKCGAAYSQKLMSRSFATEERSTSEEDVAEGALASSENENERENEETAVASSDATAEGNAVALEEVESFS